MQIQGKHIIEAMLNTIRFAKHFTPLFPTLPASDLHLLAADEPTPRYAGEDTSTGMEEEDAAPLGAGQREIYKTFGQGVFSYALLLVLADEIPNKPTGFAKVRRRAALHTFH